nr:MAG TPA: hypothetical protein [Caudoviricetes sp.]
MNQASLIHTSLLLRHFSKYKRGKSLEISRL